MLLSACGAASTLQANLLQSSTGLVNTANNQAANASNPAQAPSDPNGYIAAYEGALENVYAQVNPSVVNIHVVQQQSVSNLDESQFPFGFNVPPDGSPQYSQALGSGFVWDSKGHIVSNNHVVNGADKIEVTFSDGSIFPAKLVGADAYSDLAVIQVEGASDLLHPVQMGDSKQVKVGELAIAIGNPFGLEGTMTVGIISALGRTLPASEGIVTGPVYSIPDVIQTDAPINPGNSGGVLLDDQGQVIGVTAAIESAVNSNAGIGFVIPSAIVSKVVPSLIETGKYEHPYLGISGGKLVPDIAKAMNLPAGQRGVLVATVTEDGPAAKAGLQPSQDTTTIDGQDVPMGGDVITAIDGQTTNAMDDLIAYLSDQTEVGQTVKLTVLRDGKEVSVDVKLAARPAPTATSEVAQESPQEQSPKGQSPNPKTNGSAWLGILGAELTPQVAGAMKLDQNQQGILIVQVESGSPADQAELQGSNLEVTLDDQTVMIGGDVITAVDGKVVTSMAELRSLISGYKPGAEITLTIIRDGSSMDVPVTLAERPSTIP